MTFSYGQSLHRRKLMGSRCVGNLQGADRFIAAYDLRKWEWIKVYINLCNQIDNIVQKINVYIYGLIAIVFCM